VCVKARFKIYYLETTLLLQVLLRNTSFQSEVSMQLHKLSHLVAIQFCGFQYCFDTRWFCRRGFYRVSKFYDWIKMILILNSSVLFLFIIYLFFYLTRETAQRLENIPYLFNLNFYSTLFFISPSRSNEHSAFQTLSEVQKPREYEMVAGTGFSCAFWKWGVGGGELDTSLLYVKTTSSLSLDPISFFYAGAENVLINKKCVYIHHLQITQNDSRVLLITECIINSEYIWVYFLLRNR